MLRFGLYHTLLTLAPAISQNTIADPRFQETSGDVILRLTAEITALKRKQDILVINRRHGFEQLTASIGNQNICDLNCDDVGEDGIAAVGDALVRTANILSVAVEGRRSW